MISFEEFFNKVNPEKTKVKFNMNDANPDKKAWDYLKNDDPTWIDMNAWKSRNSPSNSFGNAEYVIALAQYYPYGANYYIFGGVYRIEKKIPEVFDCVGYNLYLQNDYIEYRKRLIFKLEKPLGFSSNRCRLFKNTQDLLKPELFELLPPLKIGPFPGYEWVSLNWTDLHDVFISGDPEWKKALSSLKGIYCITDSSNGKLYIGSASSNNDGIWQRWSSYANATDPTGGNKEFIALGSDYIQKNFKYSILEVFDKKTKQESVIARESYWKDIFMTREYGLNDN